MTETRLRPYYGSYSRRRFVPSWLADLVVWTILRRESALARRSIA